MKKITLFIVAMFIWGFFQSCKDGNLQNTPIGESNPAPSSEPDYSPFQFSFSSDQIDEINDDLKLLSDAIAFSWGDSSLRHSIRNIAQLSENDEVVYISWLEQELMSQNVNFLNILQNSLISNGYDSVKISRLPSVYKSMIVNGTSYNTLIHIPFSEDVNFEASAMFTYQFMPITSLTDLEVISASLEGEIEVASISQELAYSNPSLFVSIESTDGIQFAALPWSWCECTRDRQTSVGTSTMGNCVNKGKCGRCGRSNFKGECDSDPCAGC